MKLLFTQLSKKPFDLTRDSLLPLYTYNITILLQDTVYFIKAKMLWHIPIAFSKQHVLLNNLK